MYEKIYTPAEIIEWEKQQDPATLPILNLAKFAAIQRNVSIKRRLALADATRAAGRAARKGWNGGMP